MPTPEEHFYRQDPGEAGMLFRPSLILHITDQEFSLEVLDALADRGRNVLAGRAVLRDHPLNMATGVFNTTTYYLTMVVLNLGSLKRIPYFANGKRYPTRIRENWAEMKPRLVLPHLVVNNPGHIITLCESFDFVEHHELCIEYNVIGIQVSSSKEQHKSPSIAVFLKSPLGLVELLLERTVLRGLVFGTLFSPHFGDQRTSFFSKETMLKPMSGLSQIQDKPSKSLD